MHALAVGATAMTIQTFECFNVFFSSKVFFFFLQAHTVHMVTYHRGRKATWVEDTYWGPRQCQW